MKWFDNKRTEIFSGTIAVILGLFILLIIKYLLTLDNDTIDPSYDYISPKNIPLKELYSDVTKQTNPKDSVAKVNTFIDSSETVDNFEVLTYYYIIVGSFGNLGQAQQEADKLTKFFNANIIILPVTKEGNYRISFGKYSSLEKAKDTIKSIRTNINKDAWIFSVKQ